MMGLIVDWMNQYGPAQLWAEKSTPLLAMLTLIVLSPLWVLIASNVRFQTLQGVLVGSFTNYCSVKACSFIKTNLLGVFPPK